MGDSRQFGIVPGNGAWPNSLGSQFFTSIQRHCPDVAQVLSLEALSSSLTDEAEEVAQKPLDREFIATAVRSLTVRLAFTTIRNIVCQCAAVCESPIELATVFALGIVGLDVFDAVTFDLPAGVSGNTDGDTVLRIKPQAQIEQYRVDFLLTLVAYQDTGEGVVISQKQLVVECDGSDFHDSTVEQLIRDRRRDRQLQMRGFDVFRYSGAEIWKDCFAVARETVLFLKNSIEQPVPVAQRKQAASERSDGPPARAAGMG